MDSINIILMRKNACIAENPLTETDACRLLPESIFTAAAPVNANIAVR